MADELPGISRGGVNAEALFLTATGATRAERAALGDAVLDGKYIEVKQANKNTLNQVRAVKYITLVAYYVPSGTWYVVPASEVVHQCAQKTRGQHTENPFESATLSIKNLRAFTAAETDLTAAVRRAIDEAERYPELRRLMTNVLADSRRVADESIRSVRDALVEYGID